MNQNGDVTQRIFDLLHVSKPVLIGEGAQSRVYGLSDDKVVKIQRFSSQEPDVTVRYFEKMKNVYTELSKYHLPFRLPEIHEIHHLDGYIFMIETKLTGTPASTIYGRLPVSSRRTFLRQFLAALDCFRTITFQSLQYGQLFDAGDEIRSDIWRDFLKQMIDRKVVASRSDLQNDHVDVDAVLERFEDDLNKLPSNPPRSFVHGDYYLGNVLVDDHLDITAVVDLGPLSAVGDTMVDVAGAVAFLDIYGFTTADDREYLASLVTTKYGSEVVTLIRTYRMYYSLLFSDCKSSDPVTYGWSLSNLKDYVGN